MFYRLSNINLSIIEALITICFRIIAVSRAFGRVNRYLECNFTLVVNDRKAQNVRLKSSAFTSRTDPMEKEFLRSSLNRSRASVASF